MKRNKKWIAYDLETRTLIPAGGKLEDLEISMLGWYNSETKETKVIELDEIDVFLKEVEQADLLVGFNSIGFDNIVMRKYDPNGIIDKTPHFDMMKIAKNCLLYTSPSPRD